MSKQASNVTLHRVTSGWYEGTAPTGQHVELIDAHQHHGHEDPLWLLIVNGQCDEAYATKRDAMEDIKRGAL